MKISLIAALSKNGVIGLDGKLPWNIPEDLKRFRSLTLNHSIIMGRKTYASIGRVLPQRKNIIISRNPDLQIAGAHVCSSFEAALKLSEGDEVFVIGGAEIYRLTLPRADRLNLTYIDAEVKGDAFFPEFSELGFKETFRESHGATASAPSFHFVNLERNP